MYQLLEKHKIEVLDELEKPIDTLEQCHSVHFQGDIIYALSAIVLSFSHVFDIYLFSDISESEISYPFFDNPPISLLDSSLDNCDFPLDLDLSLSISSSHDYNSDLQACLKDDIHFMTQFIPPCIPSNIPLNNPKTIQIPSSLVDSSEQCESVQFQGGITYALRSKFLSIYHVFYIYLFSDI